MDRILDRMKEDLLDLIYANNEMENTAKHATPEFTAAQRRGDALRNALKALEDA